MAGTTKTRGITNSKGVESAAQDEAVSAKGRAAAKERRLTVAERQERGRALRAKAPRSSHAFWAETTDRKNPIDLLEAQTTTRLPDLAPIRYARMRVSPFAFLRGSAIVMAEDLARTPTSGIHTNLCGDCHLANFGAYASPERTLLFDINDFDETLPGPWEWDVKRLAASCFVASRDNGFTDADCREAALSVTRSYREHMARFAGMRDLDVWYSRVTTDDLVALLASKQQRKQAAKRLNKVRQRDSLQAFAKQTEVIDGRRVIANDPPLVVRVTDEQLGGQTRALFDMYLRSLRGAQRWVLDQFQIVDVARKVVGVGSVGTRCFIVLLTGRDENDPLFLQVKEAEPSVLQAHLPKSRYEHQGERVVAGQELMQSASDLFLGWMTGPEGRHFYWRQLRDMKGSVNIERLTPINMALYAGLCGWALARAHARSGDPIQIAAYLGASDSFDRAIATFASAYADQTERDYQAFLSAIKTGRIVAATAG